MRTVGYIPEEGGTPTPPEPKDDGTGTPVPPEPKDNPVKKGGKKE